MAKIGFWVNGAGLVISITATLLLFMHVTNKWNSNIQDMGSIAIGYLGLILLGIAVSVTGIGLLLVTELD